MYDCIANCKLSTYYSLHGVIEHYTLLLNRAVAESGTCHISSDALEAYMKFDSAMTTISHLWQDCRPFMNQISQLQVCIH